jgi:hypothetical protein
MASITIAVTVKFAPQPELLAPKTAKISKATALKLGLPGSGRKNRMYTDNDKRSALELMSTTQGRKGVGADKARAKYPAIPFGTLQGWRKAIKPLKGMALLTKIDELCARNAGNPNPRRTSRTRRSARSSRSRRSASGLEMANALAKSGARCRPWCA